MIFTMPMALRLDLMAAIDVEEKTGLPGLVRAAHMLPATADGNDAVVSAGLQPGMHLGENDLHLHCRQSPTGPENLSRPLSAQTEAGL